MTAYKLSPQLKKVTPSLVKEYNRKFEKDERYYLGDQAIIKLFEKFKYNRDIKEILLKISVINDLYSTHIFATFEMAKHIRSLNVDAALEKGDPKIVNKISQVTISNKRKNFYSFATKYCSWHNQLKYPLYDGFVGKLLITYKKQTNFYKFNDEDLRDYASFLKIVMAFQKQFKLDGFNFKEIDKFLWMYGKEVFKK